MCQSHSAVQVSVLMPLYNAERFVVAALTSILQEHQLSLEVIVIDDGSTDCSLEEVRKVQDDRIRLLTNRGKGIAAALNTGIAAAQGKIITRCDADDLYPPERLLHQVDWLLQLPEYGAICGGYSAIDAKGISLIRLSCGSNSEEITTELRQGITRTHLCTYAIRTELLHSIGGFRPYFHTGEDIDLQLRLCEYCKIWYIPEVQYHYRLHNASITHTQSSTQREFFNAIAHEFQKQRRTNGKDDLEQGNPPNPPQKTSKPLTAALHIQSFLLNQAWQEFSNGQRGLAISIGLRSLFTRPQNISVWCSLIMLLIKLARNSTLICKVP